MTPTLRDATLGQRLYFARVWQGPRTLKAFGAAIAKAEGRTVPYGAQAVCEWERDNRIPKLATLQAAANASGVRVEWLILKSGEPFTRREISQGAA